MIFKAMSHRAYQKLYRIYPEAISLYYEKKLFHDNSKGYYFIPNTESKFFDEIRAIKGITKAHDQDINNYGQCYSTEKTLKTLGDHAEEWYSEQGCKIPARGTIEWRKMYEKWAEFAFKDFSG